jgi:CubicO group peptidase (beta-lactamase class C family)
MKHIHFAIIMTAFTVMMSGQTKEEKLNQLMEAYSAINKLNGSVLITQKGKVLLDHSYGLRDVANNLPNDSATIFNVGSITKQFTAAVILKLQEQNKLNVSDKINKYFSDFRNGDKISVEHLLTHTSGIFNYTDDKVFMQTLATKPITREKMMAVFKDKPLKFVPGSDWEYSNSNYILLGYIIEKVTNSTYEAVVQDLIFKPLKMESTGFDLKTLDSPNQAKGYIVYSNQDSKESEEFDPTVSYAAGAMYTTPRDLNKWLNAIAAGQVISKASLNKAMTPYKNNYGFGNYIYTLNGKTVIAHGGLTFGYTAYLGRVAEDDIHIIILNNIVNRSINDIANNVLAILYDKPYTLPELIKEVTVSTEVLNKYAGTYKMAPQVFVAVTIENGQLFGQATGQAKVLLSAQKEDFFFIKGADIQVEFKKDALGNIDELLLIDAGQKIPAKKVK